MALEKIPVFFDFANSFVCDIVVNRSVFDLFRCHDKPSVNISVH